MYSMLFSSSFQNMATWERVRAGRAELSGEKHVRAGEVVHPIRWVVERYT